MYAAAGSIAVLGMDGHPVDVEVAIAPGLPAFTIVGLPDPSISEARERVRAAVAASREEWPARRITVNLSPAHLRKAGSSFDLAMALGVVAANGRIAPERLRGLCVLGELSLDGGVRRVRGVLPAVMAAADAGVRAVMVPRENAGEAALVRGTTVYPVEHLASAIGFLRGEADIDPARPAPGATDAVAEDLDLADVRGQVAAKRALEIAAAGGHNLLMVGPPGGGKTMLARRMPLILPPMTDAECFEVTRVYSVAGLLDDGGGMVTRRPFRAPHHSGSTVGLIGGGSGLPHPGEVSLASAGVLFMDEFPEFRRETVQALRQPMEDGVVTIVRARWAVTYPARFQLVAAANPCPCGYAGDPLRACVCTDVRKASYAERLAGPVVDRIDIQAPVARVSRRDLFAQPEGEPSGVVAARVAAARARQAARASALGVTCNARLPARDLLDVVALQPAARGAVERAVERLALSARGAHRTIRVARTIADLDGSDAVTRDHVDEAIGLRMDDREQR